MAKIHADDEASNATHALIQQRIAAIDQAEARAKQQAFGKKGKKLSCRRDDEVIPSSRRQESFLDVGTEKMVGEIARMKMTLASCQYRGKVKNGRNFGA